LIFQKKGKRPTTLLNKAAKSAVIAALAVSSFTVSLTPAFAKTSHHKHSLPAAVITAGNYSHRAAIKLAHTVNHTRTIVAVKPKSAHELRLAKKQAAHQAKLAKIQAKHHLLVAKHQANKSAHQTKVAMQDRALASGNVVEAAYSMRGARYRMGGTSRGAFDCSGFVRYILSHTGGVDLPRTATEQYYNGAPVASGDLQPGDLVFFKNTYKHGISHVGIYTGNGKFVHAANSHKGVREDSLGESYYANHYAGARRVLPAQMRAMALAPRGN
jgi:cell wall-associated NlpC family hydrolase